MPEKPTEVFILSNQPTLTLPASVLAGLYAVGTGQLTHVFMGLCPDQVEGSLVRDDDCPACRALVAADQALAAAGFTLPPHEPGSK